MNKIVPYLMFPGNCEEALNFYKDCFGGEIVSMMPFEGSPVEVPEGYKNKVLHSTFTAGDLIIMASDGMEDQPPAPGTNISLSLNFNSVDEEETVFNKLAKGGKVNMPLEDTFWGSKFGMLTDKYGISWMLSCEKKEG